MATNSGFGKKSKRRGIGHSVTCTQTWRRCLLVWDLEPDGVRSTFYSAETEHLSGELCLGFRARSYVGDGLVSAVIFAHAMEAFVLATLSWFCCVYFAFLQSPVGQQDCPDCVASASCPQAAAHLALAGTHSKTTELQGLPAFTRKTILIR